MRNLFFFFLIIKVGLSPSKKNYFLYFNESPLKMIKNAFYFILKLDSHLPKKFCFICFIESPFKMMKNAYFILKALFVPKIFKCLLRLFVHVEKTAWLER